MESLNLEKKEFHRTVRRCREAVELATKGMLLNLGIDYPPVHDTSEILQK